MAKQVHSEGFDPEKGLVGLGEIFDEAVKKGKEGSGEGEAKKKASTKVPKKTAKKTKEVSPVPESPVEGYITQLQDAFKDFPGDTNDADAAHKQQVIIEFAIEVLKEILLIDEGAEPETSVAYRELLENLEGIKGLLAEGVGASEVGKRVAFVKDKVESDIAPILKRGFRPVNIPGPDSQGTQESPEQKEIKRFYNTITERLAGLPSGADLELLRRLDFEIDALAGVVSSFADNRKSNDSERSKALIIARDLAEIHFYIEEALKKGTIDMTGSWALDIVRHRIIPMIQGNRPDAGYDGNSVIDALRQRSEAERARLRAERQKLREPQIPPAETDQTATSTKAASTPAEPGEVTEQARPKTEMRKFEDEVNNSPEFQAIIQKLGGLDNLREKHRTIVGGRMVQGREILNTILGEFRRFKSKPFARLSKEEQLADIEGFLDDTPDIIAYELKVLLERFFPFSSFEPPESVPEVEITASAAPKPPKPEARQEKKVNKLETFHAKLASATSTTQFLQIFQDLAKEGKLGLPAEEERRLNGLYANLVSINVIAHSEYILSMPPDSQKVTLELMLRGAGGDTSANSPITEPFVKLLDTELSVLNTARGSRKETEVTPGVPVKPVTAPKVKSVPAGKAESVSVAELTPANAMDHDGFVEYMTYRSGKGDRVDELDMETEVDLYKKANHAAELMIAGGYEILSSALEGLQIEDFEENIKKYFFEIARENPQTLSEHIKTATDFKNRKATISRYENELLVVRARMEGSVQAIAEKEREVEVYERAKKSSIFSGVKAAFEKLLTGRKVSQVKENIERLESAVDRPGLTQDSRKGLESEIARLKDSIKAREEYDARLEAEKLIKKGYDRGLLSSLFLGRTTARIAAKELEKITEEMAALTSSMGVDSDAIARGERRIKEIRQTQDRVYQTVKEFGGLHSLAIQTMVDMFKDPGSMAFDDLVKARARVEQFGEFGGEIDKLLGTIRSELMKKLSDRTREVLERAPTQKQGVTKTLKQGLGPVFTNKGAFGAKDENELRKAVDGFLADFAKTVGSDAMKLLYLKQLRDEFGTKDAGARPPVI